MITIKDTMPTRREIADHVLEGVEAAENNIHAINVVMTSVQIQVMLDVRDLLQSIDKRLAAHAIVKKVEKKKKLIKTI